MARIDIEIEDYLDEVATKYLVQELKKRNDFTAKDLDLTEIEIPKFKNSEQLLKYLKQLLGLRTWHDKKNKPRLRKKIYLREYLTKVLKHLK
jgi:hypothetical protein